MYYVLSPHVSLVGFLKLPYGLFDRKTGKTTFYRKSQYDLIRLCDGEHCLSEDALGADEQQVLHYLLDKQLIVARETPHPLEPYQQYIYYDNRYKGHVQWSVTGLCNYRCRHCFMSAPDAKFGQPTFEQCRTIIDGFAASGIRTVGLTGGEPLVRKDLMDIIDLLHQRGIGVSTIYTNGALLDSAFMDALKERGMRPSFQLSFDGVGCHDWMRGIAGAEEQVIRAFELIRQYDCPFGVSMALHRHNIGLIGETVRFLAQKGCSYIKINIAEPCGNWASQTEHFVELPEVYQAFLDYLPQFINDGKPMSLMLGGALLYDTQEKRFSIPYDRSFCPAFEKLPVCSCIRSGAYLSPEGVLLPCMSMVGGKIAQKFPNVLETPLPELLRSSYYTEMMSLNVSDYLAHNERCAGCDFIRMCQGGCRAVAVGEMGTDILSPDSEVCAFYRDGWYERFKSALAARNDSVYSVHRQ